MHPLRWIRKLRLETIEAFSVREADVAEPLCWVLILDHLRRAKPHQRPAPLPEEHEDEPNNYIEVLVLHSRPVDDAIFAEITRTLHDLLPEVRGRFWTVAREQVEAHVMTALEGPYRSMLDALEPIAKRITFTEYTRCFEETTEERRMCLSQDPEPFRYQRELKLRDVDVFRVTMGFFGSAYAFVILLDYRRPDTIDDHPDLKGICDVDPRDNFCRMVVIHKWPKGHVPQEVHRIVEMGFLEQLESSNYVGDFVALPPEEFGPLSRYGHELMAYLEPLLKGYGFDLKLTEIPKARFSNLSQGG